MKEAERTIDTPDQTRGSGPEARAAGDAERSGTADGAVSGPSPDDSGSIEPGTPAGADAADGPGTGSGETAASGRGRRRIGVLAAVAVTAFVLDLITKIWTVEWLEGREPVQIVGEWLQFEAVRNSGAAFGMGQALTVVFTCIATVVVIVILRLARKLYSAPWAVALGLLLGGALGNLADRVFRAPGVFQGAVVDFISPKHFAVFNLADSAIVCGGILIVLLSFRGLDPDGTVHRDDDEKQEPATEATGDAAGTPGTSAADTPAPSAADTPGTSAADTPGTSAADTPAPSAADTPGTTGPAAEAAEAGDEPPASGGAGTGDAAPRNP
ncbi:signal peptidase II [Streptomyces sp. ventii]|uniref:Lipoprotein signal peptidase n=1 Tax=Streptomyces spiramenti TaxID=2720606 RepID=A0ABX1AJN8_9ACTN|nr:signal peptidase II [Streptomyces spiramenti]